MLNSKQQTQTIQELVNLFRHRQLNLSPAFQRQSVWSERDRRLLIESMLEGVPLPSIYLYLQVGKGGVPTYDVIDGKQRLETILQFMGKGPLVTSEELWVWTTLGVDEPAQWWSWGTLSAATKHRFLTTRIGTIEVEGDLSEIIDLFVRINATGKRLTGQEKRNARYFTSPVLKAAQRFAEEQKPFMLKHRIVSVSQVQRMKHVEVIAELLLAVNAGQPLNKKTKIDEIIRGAALTTDDLGQATGTLRRAFKLLDAVLPDLRTTRFHNVSDFYSLVLLLHALRDEGKTITTHDSGRNALAGALLRDFGRGVDEVTEQMRSGKALLSHQEPFREYLDTVRSGTDSFKQRSSRERLLRSVLHGVFEERDSLRLFNATQRRIIWHASAKKRCSECREPITRWDEMSIDHVLPYSKGGKTTLENAALTHKRCNSIKGAK